MSMPIKLRLESQPSLPKVERENAFNLITKLGTRDCVKHDHHFFCLLGTKLTDAG